MLFLGAGASAPFGVPTMEGFTDEAMQVLSNEFGENLGLPELRTSAEQLGQKFDLEGLFMAVKARIDPKSVIASLRAGWQAALKSTPVLREPSPESLDMMERLESFVYQKCLEYDRGLMLELWDRFHDSLAKVRHSKLRSGDSVNWGGGLREVEGKKFMGNDIFTTNYDLIVETYCRRARFSDVRAIHTFPVNLPPPQHDSVTSVKG